MNILSTLKSVIAAFFGVQSNKNRKHDLQEGRLSYFIITGIVVVILFISCLIFIVNLVIPN